MHLLRLNGLLLCRVLVATLNVTKSNYKDQNTAHVPLLFIAGIAVQRQALYTVELAQLLDAGEPFKLQ
jgi:hypothetical protein